MRSFYRQRRHLRLLALTLIFMSLGFSYTAGQHLLITAGQGADAKVARIAFSVPPGFKLEQSSDARVAFMSNPEISLFVAVPKERVDDKYLIELSTGLASQLVSQEQGFEWKVQPSEGPKMSKYQTIRGVIKGLNAVTYVQLDYVILKVQGHETVVGSIGTYGKGLKAAYSFNHEGSEYSFTGWFGLFHLISSITGEKL